MMRVGVGWSGWLWMLAVLVLVLGIVLIVLWAAQRGNRGTEDESLETLRDRFARGEIDAAQFEEMRRVLEPTARRSSGALGLVGLLLVTAAIVMWILGSGLGSPGWFWGGMMGSNGMMGPMMGLGAGPTAPAGTAVRMAGTRFEPAILTIAPGETVRWFNDDALPHTVSAADGSWDSGNLAPGQAFERRFDVTGSYPYLCRYHPGMTGTIEVTSP
jgi:plastocyanin